MRAAKTISDLDEQPLARELLSKAVAAPLDDSQLIDLYEQLGPALLMELGRRPSLQPEAGKLAEAAFAAVRKRQENPRQLAEYVAALGGDDLRKRDAAIAGLLAARGAAVQPLLQSLGKPASAAQRDAVIEVLRLLRGDALGPLLAVLRDGSGPIAVDAMQILSALGSDEATPYLLVPALAPSSSPEMRSAAVAALNSIAGRVPARNEAVQTLVTAGRDFATGRRQPPGAVLGKMDTWSFNPSTTELTRSEENADAAARRLAREMAARAYALAPESADARRIHFAAMLEEAGYRNGLDHPLPADCAEARAAAELSVPALEDLLRYSIEEKHYAAAAAVAHLLGASGKAAELLVTRDGPAPLAEALLAANRRVRLAAAGAMVELDPQFAYAGAGRLPSALAYFLPIEGRPQALILSPNTLRTQELAGMLTALGYGVIEARDVRSALDRAIETPELTTAFIDIAIGTEATAALLQQLHRDPRTTNAPIIVWAEAGGLPAAEHVVRHDPLARAFYRPLDEAALRWQLEQIDALRPVIESREAERVAQAQRAAALLKQWVVGSGGGRGLLQSIKEPLMKALYSPQVGPTVAEIVAYVKSPEVQPALVDLASLPTQPLALRRAAAAAFCSHRKRFGLMLTTGAVLRQYDRYNQSATMDKETQDVLASILDCVEEGVPKKREGGAAPAKAPAAAAGVVSAPETRGA